MSGRSNFGAALVLATVLVVSLGGNAQAGSTAEVEGAGAAQTSPIEIHRWAGAEWGLFCNPLEWPGTPCFPLVVGWSTETGWATEKQTGVNGAVWPEDPPTIRQARTGNYLYVASVRGGSPAYAYETSLGSPEGDFTGGTVAFAIRVPTLPEVPVSIFYHGTRSLVSNELLLTLLPDGHILAVADGVQLGRTTTAVRAGTWHTISMSYGAPTASFSFTMDGTTQISASYPLGPPDGPVKVGIVVPTVVKFELEFDDYVEVNTVGADIHGARINYLVPRGAGGSAQWALPTWGSHWSDCEGTSNWEVASEDVYRNRCPRASFSLSAAKAGLVDEYVSEGIPSTHVNWVYHRDLSAQPDANDTILGVRARVRMGGRYEVKAGFVDGGTAVMDTLSDSTTYTGSVGNWGPIHEVRADGQAWTPSALSDAKIRVESLSNAGHRQSLEWVRLEYAWVP